MTVDDCRKSAQHCDNLASHYAGTELGAHYQKLAQQGHEVAREMEKHPRWHQW